MNDAPVIVYHAAKVDHVLADVLYVQKLDDHYAAISLFLMASSAVLRTVYSVP